MGPPRTANTAAAKRASPSVGTRPSSRSAASTWISSAASRREGRRGETGDPPGAGRLRVGQRRASAPAAEGAPAVPPARAVLGVGPSASTAPARRACPVLAVAGLVVARLGRLGCGRAASGAAARSRARAAWRAAGARRAPRSRAREPVELLRGLLADLGHLGVHPGLDLLDVGLDALAVVVGRAPRRRLDGLGLAACCGQMLRDLLLTLLELGGAAGGVLVELRGAGDQRLLGLVTLPLDVLPDLLTQGGDLFRGLRPDLGGLLLGQAQELLGPDAETLVAGARSSHPEPRASRAVLALQCLDALLGSTATVLGVGQLGAQPAHHAVHLADVAVDLDAL